MKFGCSAGSRALSSLNSVHVSSQSSLNPDENLVSPPWWGSCSSGGRRFDSSYFRPHVLGQETKPRVYECVCITENKVKHVHAVCSCCIIINDEVTFSSSQVFIRQRCLLFHCHTLLIREEMRSEPQPDNTEELERSVLSLLILHD